MHSVETCRGSVLVVEDEADIRNMLAQILEWEGYEVTTAANGCDALEKLQKKAPSLILLDLTMPIMNGWQFRAVQSRDPGLASIPVVVLSGGAEVGSAEDGVGGAEYLRKPVDLAILLETVERYFRA
jgi:CheY-like chemotaxis protein